MKRKIAALFCIAGLIANNTALADSNGLRTEADYHIGLSFSNYHYEEPGIMSLNGPKLGLNIEATDTWSNGYFLGGDFRYAIGTVNYKSYSSGNARGEPDWYLELKEYVGKDWFIGGSVISPYTGLGYRYLNNDARGITSTGYSGYRRESNYLYLPLGLIHQTKLQGRAKLSSTMEYDYLLLGKQKSKLSDAGDYQDVTNTQSHGYGLKLSIQYEKNNWSFGPYAHYWNIDDSSYEYIYHRDGTHYYNIFGQLAIGWEPKNHTVEFGLRASQRF